VVNKSGCQLCKGAELIQLERRTVSKSDFPELEMDASYYIWLCEKCGYIFQTTSLSGRDLECYYQKYAFNFSIDESSCISSQVQTEREKKAKSRFDFISYYINTEAHNKFLEIGCGDGALLSLFNAKGVSLMGSELNRSHHEACRNRGIEIVEFCPDKVDTRIEQGVDVVIMSHVLEHIKNPKQFLEKLSGFMSGHSSLLFVEVPDEAQVASPNNFSLEHVSYFFQPVLAKLLQDSGFDVILQERANYETTPPSLRFLCVPKGEKRLALLLDSYKQDLRDKTSTFEATFKSTKMNELKRKSVALFGGGSYAVDLMQYSGIKPSVIFDNNPSKSGLHLGGVSIQPVSEADEYIFDSVIITSWGSASEIESQLSVMPRFKGVEIIRIRDLILEA